MTPLRRIDIALPEGVPVIELLPHVLRHAGESAADDGEAHGGWVLRRTGGTLLEPLRSLATQGVHDGELLHLVPRRIDWPEPAYDDVVDVIAAGARRAGRQWSPAATRWTALAVTAALLLVGAAEVVLAGPPWPRGGLAALAFAALLLVAGLLIARGAGDAVAGGLVGAAALPYGFIGGALVTTPVAGAGSLLVGSAITVLVGVLGYLAVAGLGRLFVAGVLAGILGLVAALLRGWSMSPAGCAAVVLTLAIGLLPAYPLLATWLGRVPMPALPQRAEDMLRDQPLPPRASVIAAVIRAVELLTGLLVGAAIVVPVAVAELVATRGTAGVVLAVVGCVALLLRARLFPTAWQRVPLLAGGLVGLAVIVGAATWNAGPLAAIPVRLGVVAVLVALVLLTGLVYANRAMAPRLGRLGDFADVLAIMALVPLTCLVAGLYDAIRALFASLS
jgi:type VII secretion integral membrane protein EccD